MPDTIKLSAGVQNMLRCPACAARVTASENYFACANPACNARYPVIDGIPVLINPKKSIFPSQGLRMKDTEYSRHSSENILTRKMRSLFLSISRNVKAEKNFRHMAQLLLAQTPAPRVLVIGGRVPGQGHAGLERAKSLEIVETDVAFGPRVSLICDAHYIPFDDCTFDGIIAQAILEHVLDPARCCAEICRVVKNRGIVYAETPFMQQVHDAPYDFSRFTHLGLRRLFRHFDEIDSGATCGPGMALAWAYQHFLESFATSAKTIRILRTIAYATSFFLKYFDDFLISRPGAIDAASAVYFLGAKSDMVLSDADLIQQYKGQDTVVRQ